MPPPLLTYLGANDGEAFHALLDVFSQAFEDPQHYDAARPDAAYLRQLLGQPSFIALVARRQGRVVGGLVAYLLPKFEQARSEIYLYDLAVAEDARRQGVATALIQELRRECARRGASGVFVQADREDAHALALYERLGERAEVCHFSFTPLPA
jgi:aminoglycoside 3-N-acetyltransferase I